MYITILYSQNKPQVWVVLFTQNLLNTVTADPDIVTNICEHYFSQIFELC